MLVYKFTDFHKIWQTNILIDEENNAYLNDFGSAQSLRNNVMPDEEISRPCTVRYAAPELISQETRPSPASDVYAFGCIAFEVMHWTNYL